MDALDDYLKRIAQACQPTEQDYVDRRAVIHAVQQAVSRSSVLSQVQIIPYGSFCSGFFNSCSDLDISIEGCADSTMFSSKQLAEWFPNEQPPPAWVPLHKLDRLGKAAVLKKAANKLLDYGVVRHRDHMEYVLQARVPIIKFRESSKGIECDLAVGSNGSELKASTFGVLNQVNPCFGLLYRLVKLWAKAHAINDGSQGVFNSHCLALLVIFHLQTATPAALPALYRLFYQQPPDEKQPRLLAPGSAVRPQDALQIAQQRAQHAQRAYASTSQAPPAQLLLDFVAATGSLMEQVTLDKNGCLCLSTWHGELRRQQQQPAPPNGNNNKRRGGYVFMMEEPMDSADNPGRTFGTWTSDAFPWTLHYVIDVFDRTRQVLQAYSCSKLSAHACLLFLFGPQLLTTPTLRPLVHAFEPSLPVLADASVLASIQQGHHGRALYTLAGSLLDQQQLAAWLPPHALKGPAKFKDELVQEAELLHRAQQRAATRAAKEAADAAARAQAEAEAAALAAAQQQAHGEEEEDAHHDGDDEQLLHAVGHDAQAAGGAAAGADDLPEGPLVQAVQEEQALAAAEGLSGIAAARAVAAELAAIKRRRKLAREERRRKEQQAAQLAAQKLKLEKATRPIRAATQQDGGSSAGSSIAASAVAAATSGLQLAAGSTGSSSTASSAAASSHRASETTEQQQQQQQQQHSSGRPARQRGGSRVPNNNKESPAAAAVFAAAATAAGLQQPAAAAAAAPTSMAGGTSGGGASSSSSRHPTASAPVAIQQQSRAPTMMAQRGGPGGLLYQGGGSLESRMQHMGIGSVDSGGSPPAAAVQTGSMPNSGGGGGGRGGGGRRRSHNNNSNRGSGGSSRGGEGAQASRPRPQQQQQPQQQQSMA